jgi:hypothetical protein
VTLTASANARPQAIVNTSKASGNVITATATSTGDAESVSLKIGDYSAKLFLMGTLDAGFTADPIAADDKTAENQLLIAPATSVNDVLAALVTEFNAFSPYATATVGGVSGTLLITAKDWSDAHHGKAIQFTQTSTNSATNLGTLTINAAPVTTDDTLIGESAMITVVSKVAGETLSNVGNPLDSRALEVPSAAAAVRDAGFTVIGAGATVHELGAFSTATTLVPVTYTEDITDSPSATKVGLNAGMTAAPVNRIGWL